MARGRKPNSSKVTNIKDVKEAKTLDECRDLADAITKISMSDKDIPEIYYNVETSRSVNEISVKGKKERATDDFLRAMQALATVFCEICEIGDKVDETLIHTVNFCKNGVILSAKVELIENGIPQPLCINTPAIPLESKTGGYEMPQYAKDQLNELKKQAVLYSQGNVRDKQLNFALG